MSNSNRVVTIDMLPPELQQYISGYAGRVSQPVAKRLIPYAKTRAVPMRVPPVMKDTYEPFGPDLYSTTNRLNDWYISPYGQIDAHSEMVLDDTEKGLVVGATRMPESGRGPGGRTRKSKGGKKHGKKSRKTGKKSKKHSRK